jgi:hypothetical protein
MKLGKNDWIFIVIVAVVLAIIYAISGKEKTKKVPYDEKHAGFYAKVSQEGLKGQKEADSKCPQCHNETGGIPFPLKHPVKPAAGPMSCHLCHKYDKSRLSK